MKEKFKKLFKDIRKPEYRRLYFLVFRYLNIFKTFYFNFKVLPFKQAVKFPIWIYGRVSFVSTRGSLVIDCQKITTGMIHLGFPEDMYFNPKENGIINNDGKIIFKGDFIACCGYNLHTYGSGSIIFGNNIKLGAKVNFVCRTEIYISDCTRIAFEVVIMDTGFHYIKDQGTGFINNVDKAVAIGKYNWIGNRTLINNGTKTPDNLIVASGSMLNKNYSQSIPEYSLIGGTPAKLLKSNITRIWNGRTEIKLRRQFLDSDGSPVILGDDPIF